MSRSRSNSGVRFAKLASGATAVIATTGLATTAIVVRDQLRAKKRAEATEPPHEGPFSPEEREEAVRTYVTALARPITTFHIPFAKNVARYENGIRTGFGRTHLQWDLQLHLQYKIISEIEDLTIVVDPDGRTDTVVADFTVRLFGGGKVYVHEEFVVPVEDGLIHRIDARIRLSSPSE